MKKKEKKKECGHYFDFVVFIKYYPEPILVEFDADDEGRMSAVSLNVRISSNAI